jgi:hypothetical protein
VCVCDLSVSRRNNGSAAQLKLDAKYHARAYMEAVKKGSDLFIGSACILSNGRLEKVH